MKGLLNKISFRRRQTLEEPNEGALSAIFYSLRTLGEPHEGALSPNFFPTLGEPHEGTLSGIFISAFKSAAPSLKRAREIHLQTKGSTPFR